MRKQIAAALLTLAFLWACAGASAKDTAVKVYVDGLSVRLNPAPIMRDGKTYVSLRAVANALEATTKWNAETRTATITIGNKRARVKQSAGITVNGTLFLPLRATGEALGCTVEWDRSERAIRIDKEAPCPTGGG